MKRFLFKIDGITLTDSLFPSKTVYHSLVKLYKHMPHFCYNDKLFISGNCRMCLIQIEGIAKLAASCALPITQKLRVISHCPTVLKVRENILEFLLLNHPLDCPVCDQGGECDLQNVSLNHGLDKTRTYIKKAATSAKNISSFLYTSMSRCINCTKCLRVAYLIGYEGIALFGRSLFSEIVSINVYLSKLKNKSHELLGTIIEMCPVSTDPKGLENDNFTGEINNIISPRIENIFNKVSSEVDSISKVAISKMEAISMEVQLTVETLSGAMSGPNIDPTISPQNLILLIVVSPLILALIISLVPRAQEKLIFRVTIFGSFFINALIIYYLAYYVRPFIGNEKAFQFFNAFLEIPVALGVDNFSIILIALTSFLTSLCIVTNQNVHNFKSYGIYFHLIQFLLFISWTALDLITFYISFESVLLPMCIIINQWGSRNRKYRASYMLVLYTLAGSVCMLIAILYIQAVYGTTDIRILYYFIEFSPNEGLCLAIAFILGFMAKIPVMPFHSWLPEAHVEASTAGSIMLAGLLLKLGTYGLIRFVILLFPVESFYLSPVINTLCVLSVIFASIVALRQNDLKRIVAYSSIAHMNLIVVGIFSFDAVAIAGSLFQIISHALVSGLYFMIIGFIYDRSGTRLVTEHRGLVQSLPLLSTFLFIALLGNVAQPGTSAFVGEFLIYFGIFASNPYTGALLILGIFLGGAYNFWLYNRITYGTENMSRNHAFNYKDVNIHEIICMSILALSIIITGFFPYIILSPLTDFIETWFSF